MPHIPPSAIALYSIFLFSGANAIIGYLINVKEMSVLYIMAIEHIIPLFLLFGYLIHTRPPGGLLGPPETRLAIFAVAILSICGSLSALFTLHQLTLSEHITIGCLLPFVTGFMGWAWLGERFTKTQALCCLICVIGVGMIADPLRLRKDGPVGDDGIPDTVSGKLLGIGISLVGICLMAPQFVILRHIGDRATTAQVKIASYLAVSIASPILMMLTKTPIHIPAEPHVWQLMGVLTVVGMMASLGIAYAGQRASPTTVTICIYAGVIFATLIQWLLYGNHPSPTAFVGMAIVVMAALYGVIYGPSGVLEEPQDAESQALLPGATDRDES